MLRKQFLAAELEELKKQWDLLCKRITSLEEERTLETRGEERLRLERTITQLKEERKCLEKEMLKLEAQAKGRDVVNSSERVQQAKTQLMVYAFDPVVGEVAQRIGIELHRMEQEGIAPEDEVILQTIRDLDEQRLSTTDFVRAFKKLVSEERRPKTGPEYAALADRLQRGRVALCLGQELSHLLGASLPSTEQIIKHLVGEQDFQGPLSQLCEQEEISLSSGRTELVDRIRSLFRPKNTTPPPLYDLLAQLETPLLIISTAYDDLLEQSLQGRRKFAVIYPNMREKTCLLRYSDQRELIVCTPEEISTHKPLEHGYTLIYRLRGGIIDDDRETLLLSERDYFSFTKLIEQVFPDYLGNKLDKCALWFLGHHPESWEERLLVKSLQELRDSRSLALVIQQKLSDFSRSFWKDNNVHCFDLNLSDFVRELVREAA